MKKICTALQCPPSHIYIEPDRSGEPRAIVFDQEGGIRSFTADRPVTPLSYVLFWQSKGGVPHVLGKIVASSEGWLVVAIERRVVTGAESRAYLNYKDAAAYLFEEWCQVRNDRNAVCISA